MAQDSLWNMLIHPAADWKLFCEECARQMELIGGVRVQDAEEAEDIAAAERAEDDGYYDNTTY